MRTTMLVRALPFLMVALTGCGKKEYCDYAAVIEAAQRGDAEKLRREIAKPAPPTDALDRWFGKDISYATIANRNKSRFESSALQIAAFGGNVDAVKVLLDGGLNVNLRDQSGNTALFYATMKDHREVASLLLQRGANPNLTGAGDSPLAGAIVSGDAALAGILLEKGADPNGVGPNGPLLNTAVGSKSAEIVRQLVDKGANPNAKGGGATDTPFCRAALGDSLDVLNALIEKADVNQPCEQDSPAIYLQSRRELVSALLKAGARVDVSRLWMTCDSPEITRVLVVALKPEERSTATAVLGVACRH